MAYQINWKTLLYSLNRTLVIAEKEWIQIRRDKRSFIMALVIPVFLLFIFAYGLSLDIKNISLAVVDHDLSPLSRDFLSHFRGNTYLIIKHFLFSEKEAEKKLIQGDVKLVLVIPQGFQQHILNGKSVSLQLLVDGSETTTATVAMGYLQTMVYEYNINMRNTFFKKRGLHLSSPLQIENRILYNPELASKNFIIPGIIVIVMAILSAVITSLTIAREWERHTIETLLTTPLTKYERDPCTIFLYSPLFPFWENFSNKKKKLTSKEFFQDRFIPFLSFFLLAKSLFQPYLRGFSPIFPIPA